MAANKLTDSGIKSAKCPIGQKLSKLNDGEGLTLEVMPTGGKLWRYRYRFNGKQNRLSLGKYPLVTLLLARERAKAFNTQVAQGFDPSQVRKEVKKEAKRITGGLGDTFAEIAAAMVKVKAGEWSPGHLERTNSLLRRDLLPLLGHRVLREIELPELTGVLRLIEDRGALEALVKACSTCRLIWTQAARNGNIKAAENITRDLGGFKKAITEHYATITDPEIFGQLLRSIDAYHGGLIVKAALRLVPMLFQRPTELRRMAWSELDLDAGMWSIASARMKRTVKKKKNGEPHLVPLPVQAVAILRAMQPITGDGALVFRSERSHDKPMSENTLRVALMSMGYAPKVQTVHGFRAAAKTIMAEVLELDVAVVDRQQSHAVKDPLGRAYDRTTYIKQRTAMMQKWADYLDVLKSEKVIQLKRQA